MQATFSGLNFFGLEKAASWPKGKIASNPAARSLEKAHIVHVEAIVAAVTSEYPDQVANVPGFPYGSATSLKVAPAFNDQMKSACTRALAALVRGDLSDEVAMPCGCTPFGRDYLVPPTGAKAGMDTGVCTNASNRQGFDRHDVHRLAARDRGFLLDLRQSGVRTRDQVAGATMICAI